ncbi:hypothetical protein B0I37DRAFT_421759 [Chaetomium sp. MPI-CAGE-AT-0009]|nr:hypothetical protein B0I37DRAFT_421759 [Chaetomium sp. MPI-CAGE-AT-0009]
MDYDSPSSEASDGIYIETLQPSDLSDIDSKDVSDNGALTEDDEAEDDTMEDDEAEDDRMEDVPKVDNDPTGSEVNSEPSDREGSDEEELDDEELAARDTEYFSYCAHQETEHLASLIEALLQKKIIELAELESVAAEGEKVAGTLDKIITLVNAVKQDLIDTGSTSLRRWNQLQAMEWDVCRLKRLVEGVPGVPTAVIIDDIVEDITLEVSAWQARLGLTLKLIRDVELAIERISHS